MTDETTTTASISRQARWQRRKRAEGKCIQCGKDSGGKYRCSDCKAKQRLYERVVKARRTIPKLKARLASLEILVAQFANDPSIEIAVGATAWRCPLCLTLIDESPNEKEDDHDARL